MLSRRQALLFGARGLAGQETPFARPALFAARELAVGRRFAVVVGHISS
jgi:hypothetical protein